MARFYNMLVNRKILVPVLFVILAVAGVLMIPLTKVNYDMAEYLPEKAGTKQAIELAKKEFDYPGTAQVMAKDISIAGALELKNKITQVEGVKNVIWLDDVVDIAKPLDFIDKEQLDNYYKDNCALYSIEFEKDDYAESTTAALENIRLLDNRILISGNAENSRNMKGSMSGEVMNVIAIVMPICILILMIASHTWMDPFLYLFVIGISIAVNMGTNAFFGNVSFITNSMGSVLQLAVSMDYSIFLLQVTLHNRVAVSIRRIAAAFTQLFADVDNGHNHLCAAERQVVEVPQHVVRAFPCITAVLWVHILRFIHKNVGLCALQGQECGGFEPVGIRGNGGDIVMAVSPDGCRVCIDIGLPDMPVIIR